MQARREGLAEVAVVGSSAGPAGGDDCVTLHRASVGLRAEAERYGLAAVLDGQGDNGGGLADGVAQQIGGVGAGGGW